MAKYLPYFKFEPSAWTHGNIQMCSNNAKISFIEMCCIYWNRTGDLSFGFALIKCCNNDETIINELIDEEIIICKNDKIIINFLDEQLAEFIDLSASRSESGRKGGQNGAIRPKEERTKGNQIYFLRCWNNDEEFIKMGTTKNSISRRYSGKMPYQYEIIFQLFSDNYIQLENTIHNRLRVFEYKPKLNFQGQKECYLISKYDDINAVLIDLVGSALATLKRTEAIREEKIREDKSKNYIDFLYNLYPVRCPISKRALGKGKKSKDKIGKLLKQYESKDIEKRINLYIQDCNQTRTYYKSFDTFLNNIDTVITDEPVQKKSTSHLNVSL